MDTPYTILNSLLAVYLVLHREQVTAGTGMVTCLLLKHTVVVSVSSGPTSY
jgi:hypothetical protein